MKNTKLILGYKTDHSEITLTFSTSLARRGKGYWKYNSLLLRDSVYVERLRHVFKTLCPSTSYVEIQCINDLLNVVTKYSVKFLSISISHSITKTREEKDLALKLEKDKLNLEDTCIMNSAPSELIQSFLNNKKK
jgi:hypothetical protein